MNTPDPDTTVTPPPAANNDSDLATLLAEPASPRWYRRPALWAAALALTLAALGLWWWLAQRTANAAPSYSTQTVARGNLTLTVTANGTLQPTRSTSIGSELSGTVLKVNVDVNDRIRKGQVLVELDTAKLRDQILRSRAVLSAATAKVAQTVATVKEARANLARITRVGFGSTITDNVVTYLTYLDVDNSDLSLRPGMTATATITATQRSDVLLVPNSALRFTPTAVGDARAATTGGIVASLIPGRPRTSNRKSAAAGASTAAARQVWVLRDELPVPLAVTPGISDGRMTEITGGELAIGMQVITDQKKATDK